MLHVPPQGDPRSRIYIVGDAPNYDDEFAGVPFSTNHVGDPRKGSTGRLLNALLQEAGIERHDCYVTNVCQYRPPEEDMDKWLKRTKNAKGECKYKVHPHVQEGLDELKETIQRHRPQLVIGFGNTPLWGLAGEWGVTAWRGSEMVLEGGIRFVPTLHPSTLLRSWHLRPLVVHDLRYRCARRLAQGFDNPQYRFLTYPGFDEVMNYLEGIEGMWAADIESSKLKTLCIGVGKSPREAMCIPFWDLSGRIYTKNDERLIVKRLNELSHDLPMVGQNWNYDRQYLWNDFGLDFAPSFDTYIAQSVLFPGSERGLGYLSSMYCDHHLYWKEDGKEWNNIKDFPKEFRYNCTDACKTLEVAVEEGKLLERDGLNEQFKSRMRYGNTVFRMMMRGVERSQERTGKLLAEVNLAICEREDAINSIAGKMVNLQSPKQITDLLFKQLGFKPVGRKTKGGSASTNDEALRKLSEKEPEAGKICTPLLEARSLSNLKANFLEAELDPDGRLRSSWMATGTETFRLTSGKNAYHRGGPLQNITDGKHTHSGRKLPNLRATIVPPPGCVYWNCDLERADVQVVAWEAEDDSLKRMLKDRADIHLVNAVELFDIKGIPYDECFPTHSRYMEHKDKWEQKRHFAKTFTHLTDYGGTARTAAIKTHSTVKEAERAQKRWFELHPGILRWHKWIQACLAGTRTVRNRFGYRRVYFDRVEDSFTEALAWIPQSTVSLVISLVQMEMEERLVEFGSMEFSITPEVSFWNELQVHDSLSGWMREDKMGIILPLMRDAAASVVVPYDDPLCIPLELAVSTDSWGEVKKVEWT